MIFADSVTLLLLPTIVVGDDYNFTTHVVHFSNTTTNVTVNVSLNNDTMLEGNENFTLSISPSSQMPDGVTIGNINETTVIIKDDDCKCVK